MMNETKPTEIDRKQAEKLLAAVVEAQNTFWDAISDLEAALGGIEIDDVDDYDNETIDTLLERFGDDSDSDDEEEEEEEEEDD